MDKLRNIKSVFLDIDGTLTNNNKEITEQTKACIKKITDKGIYVILCSGRSNKDVCRYSMETLASNYAISSNGAQIYNYGTNENLYKNDIKYLYIKNIWEYCHENNLELVLNGENDQYGNKFFCSDMYKNKVIIHDVEELRNITVYQIIINSNNYYDMQDCENYIKLNENFKIANYSREYISKDINSKEPYYIFINNKSVDKGVAISEFLKKKNINSEAAICFGDRINDITMFNNCGYKVAMQNADKELKELANYITLSNDENGVADFLNKYILK